MSKSKTLQKITPKNIAINKANAQIVAIVAGAAFVSIFCLFAAKAAFSSMHYHMKVASAQSEANDQLDANIANFATLQSNYKRFDKASTNIIGGSSKKDGTGPNDGTNSQIVLDALPVAYDFPRVTSSIEKILRDRSFSVSSISGTDDEINQQSNGSSISPVVTDVPFAFAVDRTNYNSITQLIDTLKSSIRPIKINNISITGGGDKMSLTVNAQTYYQPPKLLKNDKRVIK